jgi:5'-deoxynucleotidase YfbR-like HD superfamily hydrolase
MTKTAERLTELQDIINQLSLLKRNHYIAGTDERENVADHSLTVAMFAWYLHDITNSKLDLHKIQQYAIIHDFVEVHAGDTNTFANQNERSAKEDREKAALGRFESDFSDFGDMVMVMGAYQDMKNDEARFVWTADKLQQLIQGRRDNWRPYYEIHITNDRFDQKMQELSAKALPELRPIFDETVNWSKQTYSYEEAA